MQRLLRYFSFKGRANRQRYWLTSLSIYGLFFVSAIMVAMLPGPLALVVVPIWLGLLIAGLATSVRRLHDRKKSAWWLLLFGVLPALLSAPIEVAKEGPEGLQAVAAILALLGLPFGIWSFVEMGCLKGTAGPNKYGPDPLAPAMEEVFA